MYANVPILIQRFLSLQEIHTASSSFRTRLTAIEENQKSLETMLLADRTLLATMQASLDKNVLIFQENMLKMTAQNTQDEI